MQNLLKWLKMNAAAFADKLGYKKLCGSGVNTYNKADELNGFVKFLKS